MDVAFLLSPTGNFQQFGDALAEAEGAGYAVAWVPDQAFHCDPFVALAYAATRTSRMQLGLGVTNPYTRHPALIARAAASLSVRSAGSTNFVERIRGCLLDCQAGYLQV